MRGQFLAAKGVIPATRFGHLIGPPLKHNYLNSDLEEKKKSHYQS